MIGVLSGRGCWLACLCAYLCEGAGGAGRSPRCSLYCHVRAVTLEGKLVAQGGLSAVYWRSRMIACCGGILESGSWLALSALLLAAVVVERKLVAEVA